MIRRFLFQQVKVALCSDTFAQTAAAMAASIRKNKIWKEKVGDQDSDIRILPPGPCGAEPSPGPASTGSATVTAGTLTGSADASPASPATEASPTTLLSASCKHWLSGYCSWGVKCRFAHSMVPEGALVKCRVRGDDELLQAPHGLDTKQVDGNESDAKQADGPQTEQVDDDGEQVGVEVKGKWVWKRPTARLWVHIFLHKRHDDFDLVPMSIGRGGRNMRDQGLVQYNEIYIE